MPAGVCETKDAREVAHSGEEWKQVDWGLDPRRRSAGVLDMVRDGIVPASVDSSTATWCEVLLTQRSQCMASMHDPGLTEVCLD